MTDGPLVIDNSVLSAFDAAGWFDSLESCASKRSVVISEHVWNTEFVPVHELSSAPEWISISSTDVVPDDYSDPGALTVGDLTCIELGKQLSNSTVVTNDKELIETADGYRIDTEWGTALARRLYQQCAISRSAFDMGVGMYIDDVYLPDDAATILRETEKANES